MRQSISAVSPRILMEANGMYWEGCLLEGQGVHFAGCTRKGGDFLLLELMETCDECTKAETVRQRWGQPEWLHGTSWAPLGWLAWVVFSNYRCWPGKAGCVFGVLRGSCWGWGSSCWAVRRRYTSQDCDPGSAWSSLGAERRQVSFSKTGGDEEGMPSKIGHHKLYI